MATPAKEKVGRTHQIKRWETEGRWQISDSSWGAQFSRLESGWAAFTSTEACICWAMQSPSPSPPWEGTNKPLWVHKGVYNLWMLSNWAWSVLLVSILWQNNRGVGWGAMRWGLWRYRSAGTLGWWGKNMQGLWFLPWHETNCPLA